MRRLWIAAVLVVVILAAAGTYLALYRPAPGDPVTVEIPVGRSTIAIARQLDDERVIGSVLGFRVAARLRGLDGGLQAGRYELRRKMGVQAALDALSGGPEVKIVGVTIPEGYTVRRIAARVGQKTHIKEAEFLAAGRACRARTQLLPQGTCSIEGFLFPETYGVEEDENADALMQRMVATFEDRASSLDWSGAESRGLSRYQAVIVASIVEREAKVDEDRPKVSAVIYNRLAKRMRLEIDATALYDLPAHKVPTRKDLERPSPYNTYLNAGLPPTPISNPGLESLRAAMSPAPIDALYYVVIDPSGRHGFTASYEEFQELKKRRPPETTGRR